jgi:hypothetical protein
MEKSIRNQIYRSMWKDIGAEISEQVRVGKNRLESEGVTFSVFKDKMSECLVFADYRPNWYGLFRDYCHVYGSDGALSISDFAELHFRDFKMSTHGVRLKSKPDERL